MIQTIVYNFKIASEAIIQNKIRAILTSLGIICGVASVIAMLAIGRGAEQAILEKMRLLGTNNIIVKSLDKKEIQKRLEKEEDANPNDKSKDKKNRFTPGLSLLDASAIRSILPNVNSVCSEIQVTQTGIHESFTKEVQLIGVESDYFHINGFDIDEGNYFSDNHLNNSELVCIIGNDVKNKLFPTDDPIGKKLKCGNQWLTVIGIIKSKSLSDENIQKLNIRNYNLDVYVPISTLLLRFVNRGIVSKKDFFNNDDNNMEINRNQIDRIIINFKSSDKMIESAEIIKNIMKRRHNQVEDYEVIVPSVLLEQEQSTQRIFNIVLSVIASISLIVGGIGIMNIMLASILERTKEIGIRKAVGATRQDILLQFLSEAVAISLTGGILGIVLGITVSLIIEKFTGITTIVGLESVLISFLVSISVGLLFGIAPARKASLQDTIELLRYE